MRGWCRVRLATEGSNFRKWQDYAVDSLAGKAKSAEDRISLERFVDGLYELDASKHPDLCKLDRHLSRFMYTRGQLSSMDGVNSVEVDTALWDTGNGGPSVMGESFYNSNREIFQQMVEDEEHAP